MANSDEINLSSSELTAGDLAKDSAGHTAEHTDRHLMGKIELLEERAVVNKERLDVGKITATKQVRSKTVNVPIELVEEVLVIDTEYYDADSKAFLTSDYDSQDIIRHIEPTLDSQTMITINGNKVALSEGPIEVVLSRQVAFIKKETHAVQDVSISKSVHTHQDTINVELRREELDVIEEGMLGQHDQNKLHD